MQDLSIDLETFSSNDIKYGVYKYTEAPDFEVLLFGYSVDGGDVEVVDLASGEKVPDDVIAALTDDTVTKWAFNCSFERVCLSAWLRKNYPDKFVGYGDAEDTVGNYLNPAAWKCSMVWCAYLGLPLSLKGAGAVLKLDEQKLAEGKNLIAYFCSPCRPTKSNGNRTRNLPEHDKEKWELFKSYNRRDVEVELAIKYRLAKHPVPAHEWKLYHLDQMINDRGVKIDVALATHAMAFDKLSKAEATERLKAITGLENPNSVMQMSDWLTNNGISVTSLGKKEVAAMLKTASPKCAEVLTLRQQTAKSSVKKYEAMVNTACSDHRCRGLFQFMGANRSLRWAGRNVQLQNLPQNHISDLAEARQLVIDGDYKIFSTLYSPVPSVLSELIRTSLVPKQGYKFIVTDFSAIEARVLSWLAGEEWRNEVFRNNGDIYCASASAMFGVPVEKHGRNSHLRQKGKISELALGYGGGKGALAAMGALEMGIAESELPILVEMWRTANPNIVRFWWDIDHAVMDSVIHKTTNIVGNIIIECTKGMLYLHLPSGSTLSYVKPTLGVNQFGSDAVTYEGVDGKTHKWCRIESYGPKFVENITQHLARALLCNALVNLKNHYITAHIHDEIVLEASPDISVRNICEEMCRLPSWAEGLCLTAAGYEGSFYYKD